MNKINFFKTLIVITTLSFASCSQEGELPVNTDKPNVITDKPNVDAKKLKYIVAFQENKVGKAEEVDYVLSLDSLESLTEGSFDVKGKGTAQTGWRFFYQANNTLFTAGYAKDVTSRAYGIGQDGKLEERGVFTYDSTLDCFTASEDGSKMIAVQLSHGGLDDKVFFIIDSKTGKVERKIKHPIDIDKGKGTKENPGSIPWVSGMVQKGNKLYVSYFKWSALGDYTTPASEDKAKVAIFNYPEMTLDKIIETKKTGPLGINGGDTGIELTESGDMYAYSCLGLSAGFTSKTSKKSGVVRIKSGTNAFDENYFFNVEEAPNGGKLFWMKYIANGKALARIIVNDTNGAGAWGAFLKKDVLKMVVLDLNSKTITDVQGAPNPQGQRYVSSTGILIENGKVYTGITDVKETAVYEIDVESATAKKGAVATNARSLKGIFKLN